jgi:hypothetical protein
MSVRAGEILHVAGNNVIDRIQSAGLGNVQVPIERILEVGNRETVDKVPGEPDFTFSMESLDVSVELLAFLSGQVSGSGSASVAETLADGTSFDWLDVAGRAVNITSPWKDPATGSAGVVEAGHLIPGYYVTRLAYRYGVTDNASQSVDLSGGAFFYGEFAPTEAFFTGDGATDAFVTPNNAVGYRKGGADGSTFKSVFGVIVDGTLQTEDVDYVVTPGTVGAGARTVTFTVAPANGADVRVCYFTNAAKAFPQSVHASTLVKPGAVRGRNIRIVVEGDRIGGVQSFELDATCTGTLEREMGTEDVVGYSLTETTRLGHHHDPRQGQGRVLRLPLAGHGGRALRGLRLVQPEHGRTRSADREPQEPRHAAEDDLRVRRAVPAARHPGARQPADRLRDHVGVEARQLPGVQGRQALAHPDIGPGHSPGPHDGIVAPVGVGAGNRQSNGPLPGPFAHREGDKDMTTAVAPPRTKP